MHIIRESHVEYKKKFPECSKGKFSQERHIFGIFDLTNLGGGGGGDTHPLSQSPSSFTLKLVVYSVKSWSQFTFVT